MAWIYTYNCSDISREESRRYTARNLDEQEKEEDGEAQEEEHRVKQEEESMQKAGKSVLGQKRRESVTPRLSQTPM